MEITQDLPLSIGAQWVALDLPPDPPSPFNTGEWEIGWSFPFSQHSQAREVRLRWRNVEEQIYLSVFKLGIRGSSMERCIRLDGLFPPARAGWITSKGFWQACGNKAVLVARPYQDVPPVPVSAETVCRRFAELTLQPGAHNVLLSFPSSRHNLWTSEAVLRQSPYFATLLDSGFAENAIHAPPAAAPKDEAGLPKPFFPTALPPHKVITVTDVPYLTYLAVVCWMQCGHIAFASPSFLSSRFHSENEVQLLADLARSPPRLPPPYMNLPHPVSPKLVIELSHFLDLPDLTAAALDSLTRHLTPPTALDELFSEFSTRYDEVRAACLDWIAAHADEVLATERMKELERDANTELLSPEQAAVWARLAFRMLRRA
ncbi:hypothetical protein JCM10213_006451 [Rhodosporidiobolus nylandii]